MKHIHLIDHVYIVNLPSREDRRKQWLRNLAFMPSLEHRFEFFKAIDGRLVNTISSLRPGELGCSMSHAAIWKDASRKGYKYIVVFEDDALINKDFEQELEQLFEACQMDFDWLYLFNSWDFRPTEPYSDILDKVIASLGTVAYVMNVSSVNRILPYVEEFRFPVDVVMGHMCFLSKVYRPKNMFVLHDDESASDVRTGKNHEPSFLRRLVKRLVKIILPR